MNQAVIKANESFEEVLSPQDQEYFTYIYESQFNIAKHLEKHPNRIVMLENLSELQRPNPKDMAAAKLVFPNGLPAKASDLNFAQQSYLVLTHAAHTALHLGIINEIHPDHPDNIRGKTNHLVYECLQKHPGEITCASVSNQIREFSAVSQAKYLAEKFNKNVFIIYGFGHSFKNISSCLNPTIKLRVLKHLESRSLINNKEFYEDRKIELAREVAARPVVNCTYLNDEQSFPRLQLPSPLEVRQVDNNLDMAIGAFTGLILVGLTLFGYFRNRNTPNNLTNSNSQQKHKPVK